MTLKKLKDREVILWPQYFDSSLSRKEGRKVPKELGVPKPSQKELVDAAEALNLEPRALEGRYPREWWNKEGPVAVKKVAPKRKIMIMIAEELKRRRYERKE